MQRPDLRDVLPAHVEEAGADRREQPLVQAGAVVVALEVAQLEREVRERVRAVDDRLDAARPRHARRSRCTGKSCPVRFVMWQKWSTFVCGVIAARAADRRDRPASVGGTGNEICVDLDPVAPRALVPGVEHAAVVLFGRDDFVARASGRGRAARSAAPRSRCA